MVKLVLREYHTLYNKWRKYSQLHHTNFSFNKNHIDFIKFLKENDIDCDIEYDQNTQRYLLLMSDEEALIFKIRWI